MPEYAGRTFDRRPEFDDESRGFPITRLLAIQGAPSEPRSYTWACQPHLDQGAVGACVGFGWSHELAARPKEIAGITNKTALELYHQAQQADEWEGDDYEGTSVLAGAKVVQASGFMPEYRWGFGLLDVLLALAYHGPVVLGLPWKSSMMEPRADGTLDCSGGDVGGHCILANGVSVKRRVVRVHQSWGVDWGPLFGDALVSWNDLEALLAQDGEACVPVLRVKQAVPA